QMMEPDNTPVKSLLRAHDIGKSQGLKFVYAGNLPGEVGKTENTFCPSCAAALIERTGFRVLSNRLAHGKCHKCGTEIPGRWE
ncbi:MAG TPA: AmmeMemoRadiSam system radical SAM enzyme, partial [Bacteroidota bacterium]|nr:AmmeMemoRadiSam system radical SAM enzyme [Bacteroidota bacterium]